MATPTFFPRPEAHPMQWRALLLPVQHAVRDLLVRIEGATSAPPVEGAASSNCFLVYGQRGSGKSTVLLSAKYACEFPGDKKSDFFGAEKSDVQCRTDSGASEHRKAHEAQSRQLLQETHACIDKISNLVWLDVLDLEPLSQRANLLTTLLTRVRNALCLSACGKDGAEFTSILEDDWGRSDSAYQKLSQLIADASIMWEDINEPDTRSQANRRVAAADKYAGFKAQFLDALKALSREIGRSRGNRNACYRIVLPIDNIDRSTDHLHGIVKLALMVSCPYLWLVMAGDRQDIETFLERAYWKELIRVGEGAGGTGKSDAGGEDETLVMARRQAAAASHKLLPPSHRIEVQLVHPLETLAFSPDASIGQSDRTIRELFAEIEVAAAEKGKMRFIDLFCTRNLIHGLMGEVQEANQEATRKATKGPHLQSFTTAANMGLRLPARGVLDLWQLAYWVLHDDVANRAYQAEKIARTMLRNSIVESGMTNLMGRFLQEKIIRRNSQGGTVLDFSSDTSWLQSIGLGHVYLESRSNRTMTIGNAGEKDDGPVELTVQSSIGLWTINVMSMAFKWDEKHDREMLPDLVVAWLCVLYDVVIWGEEESIVIAKQAQAPLIWKTPCITYQIIVRAHPYRKVSRTWPIPAWKSFIENEVCGQYWDYLSHHLDDSRALFEQAGRDACLSRLLLVCWVACMLETFSLFAVNKNKLDASIFTEIKHRMQSGSKDGQLADAVASAEKKVLQSASEIYAKISRKKGVTGVLEPVWLEADGAFPIRDWLEDELPLLLLTDIYLPLEGDPKLCIAAIFDALEDTDLAACWKNNQSSIQDAATQAARQLLPPPDTRSTMPPAIAGG